MRTVVVDPGAAEAALRLARDVRDRLVQKDCARVILTQGRLGPRERARVAFHNSAAVFVCLGGDPGADLATDPRLPHPATQAVRVCRAPVTWLSIAIECVPPPPVARAYPGC